MKQSCLELRVLPMNLAQLDQICLVVNSKRFTFTFSGQIIRDLLHHFTRASSCCRKKESKRDEPPLFWEEGADEDCPQSSGGKQLSHCPNSVRRRARNIDNAALVSGRKQRKGRLVGGREQKRSKK